jgi:RNA polymerase sigma-70 factor (ECF subfamily)
MSEVKPDSAETRDLLDRYGRGDRKALDELLRRYREPMHCLVDMHLDPRVRQRVSASDVVQDAQMDVARRIDDYLQRRPMPFHLWVRKTAYERLIDVHRRERRGIRDVDREEAVPDRSSLALARSFVARGPSPSQEAQARELADRVAEAVAGLSEADRAVLLMRHVEDLPYEEIACLLDIEEATARKRYGRALLHLQQALAERGLPEEGP